MSYDLGKDAAGHSVVVKKGPYGWYAQLGEGKDAKRVSIPKNMEPSQVDLEKALALLSLPRVLGNDPETNEVIETSIGRFGPYVKRGKTFQSLQPSDDVLTIDLQRALALLSNTKSKAKVESISLGNYEGTDIQWLVGRYGPYLKWGQQNIALPKELKNPDQKPTLEQAIAVIQKKKN